MFEFKSKIPDSERGEGDPPQADNRKRPVGSALGVNIWNISRIEI